MIAMDITADSKINDVLAKHPGTAPVFTQGRRLYVDQRNDLYARFPGLSVGEFARQNRMDLAPLLAQLNALAESEASARASGAAGADEMQRPEAPQELEEDAEGTGQLDGAGMGALQEADLFGGRGPLAPLRSVRGRRGPRDRLLRAQARYSGPWADCTATTETLSGAASSRGRWLHV